MAKIEVILNEVQAVCSKEQWDAADQAEHRDFFTAGKTYGGKEDKAGKWEARKIAFRDRENGWQNRTNGLRSTFVLPLQTLGESFNGKVYSLRVEFSAPQK